MCIVSTFLASAEPDFTISDFDAGAKDGTATLADEYGHTPGALELSSPYAKKDPQLAAYWKFENNADDITGIYNREVRGATYTKNGKSDGAYDFDGVDDTITTPAKDDWALEKDDSMTIALWMKTDTLRNADIFGRNNGAWNVPQWTLNLYVYANGSRLLAWPMTLAATMRGICILFLQGSGSTSPR